MTDGTGPERTCRYEPEMYAVRIEEDGTEIVTDEPDDECECFVCSECSYCMMFGADSGWFGTEPPYKAHFRYCPGCGARVVE